MEPEAGKEIVGSVIRDAVASDLPALAELMYQLGHDGGTHPDESRTPNEAQRRALDAFGRGPWLRLLVIERGGRVVGTTMLLIIPNLSAAGRPRGMVENVVIDERCRGQGLGERLMAYCLDEARRAGCFKVQLSSNSSRSGAHRFYERLGFVHTSHGFSYVF